MDLNYHLIYFECCPTGRWFWKHLPDNLPGFQRGKAWRDNWSWKDNADKMSWVHVSLLVKLSKLISKTTAANVYLHEKIASVFLCFRPLFCSPWYSPLKIIYLKLRLSSLLRRHSLGSSRNLLPPQLQQMFVGKEDCMMSPKNVRVGSHRLSELWWL